MNLASEKSIFESSMKLLTIVFWSYSRVLRTSILFFSSRSVGPPKYKLPVFTNTRCTRLVSLINCCTITMPYRSNEVRWICVDDWTDKLEIHRLSYWLCLVDLADELYTSVWMRMYRKRSKSLHTDRIWNLVHQRVSSANRSSYS